MTVTESIFFMTFAIIALSALFEIVVISSGVNK